MKVPPFNSMRQTSSLPTHTCTCGGSKLFSLVLTTKRNCPSVATVGTSVPQAVRCLPRRHFLRSVSRNDTSVDTTSSTSERVPAMSIQLADPVSLPSPCPVTAQASATATASSPPPSAPSTQTWASSSSSRGWPSGGHRQTPRFLAGMGPRKYRQPADKWAGLQASGTAVKRSDGLD